MKIKNYLTLLIIFILSSCVPKDQGITVDKKLIGTTLPKVLPTDTTSSTNSTLSYRLSLSGLTTVVNNDCSMIVVNSLDMDFLSQDVETALTVNLTLTGAGQFFSNSTCSTNITTITIPSSESLAIFYYKPTSIGSSVIKASASQYASAQLAISTLAATSTGPAVPTKLKIAGPQNFIANSCAPLNLVLLDQYNNSINASSSTALTFSGLSSLYSNSTCTTNLTTPSLLTGESNKLFYAKVATSGGYILNVSAPGLSGDNFPLIVTSEAIVDVVTEHSLQLVGQNQFNSQLCMPFSVNLLGSNGLPFLATSNKNITLSGTLLTNLYSDSDCLTNLSGLSDLTINSGSSNTIFYFKISSAGNLILGASSSGLVAASSAISVTAPPASLTYVPTKLKVSGPQSIQINNCIPLNVSLLDQANNSIAAASSTVVNFSGVTTIYSDAVCSTSATSVTLSIGDSNKIFYARVASAGGSVLTSAAAGLTTDYFPVVAIDPPPSNTPVESSLQFTGPTQFSENTCVPFNVNLLGSNGLPILATSNKTVTLSGMVLGNLFSDSSCSTNLATLSSLIISTGATNSVLYVKVPSSGIAILGASSPSLTSASTSVLVTAVAPAPSAQSLAVQGVNQAGRSDCVPLSATVLNSNNVAMSVASNTTINFASSNASLKIYSNPVCSSEVTNLTMLTGESLLSFYVQGVASGNYMLTLSSTGLSSINHPLNISNAPTSSTPFKLYLSTVSQAVEGVCTAITVNSLDFNGNPVNVSSNTTATLSSIDSNITFYSNNTCTTSTTTAVISNATNYKTIYFKADSGLSALLLASASGLADSQFNLSILPPSGATGSPIQLRILGATGIYTDTCNIFQVQSVDENNVPRNVSADKTITLAGAGAGSFYSDSNCSSAIASTIITNGSHTKTIYYNNMSVENLLFSVSTTGLLSNTQSEILTANPESLGGLKIEGQQNIVSSTCVPYVISALKNNGGVKTLSSNLTFTLSSGGGVSWYSNSNCSTALVTPTILNTQSTITYYAKVTSSGNYLLSATKAGLNSGNLGIAVTTNVTDIGINFEDFDFSIVESAGSMRVRVLLTSPAPASVTIPFTISGSSSRPSDHTLASGNLTITMGQSSGQLNFVVNDDALAESAEDLIISLGTAPSGYYLGVKNVLTMQIYDNDTGSTSVGVVPDGFKTVSVGTTFSCGVTTSGGAKCWGDNASGQLGDNTIVDKLVPTDVSGLTSGVMDIKVGTGHACALLTNGGMKCWGLDTNGQLGNGTPNTNSPVPVDVITLTSGVSSFQIGGNTTCAILNDGALKCWGYSASGQVGNGSTSSVHTPYTVYSSGVTQITMGSLTNCALYNNGVYCWGSMFGVYSPTLMNGLSSGVVSLAKFNSTSNSSFNHMCAILTTGEVKCWGQGLNGELGNGGAGSSTTPVSVSGLGAGSGAISVSVANPYGTCALMNSGAVKCWGSPYYLGTGETTNQSNIPLDVDGLDSKVSEINMAYYRVCALKSNGSVYCWGLNSNGQLGDGTAANRYTPKAVFGFGVNGAKKIFSSNIYSTCLLTLDNKMKCWGYNDVGQLGNGSLVTKYYPTELSQASTRILYNYKNLLNIQSGNGATCGLNNFGVLNCWGNNAYSQMADGSSISPANVKPAAFLLPEQVSSYSVGGTFSCAVNTSGDLKCWGQNNLRQLGDGTSSSKTTPSPTAILSNVTQVDAGWNHACAIVSGGLKCWGENDFGQIGTGTSSTYISTPTDVAGLTTGVLKVSAGNKTTCAIVAGGTLKCWGYGGYGKIGDSSGTSRLAPTNVTGLSSGVIDVVVGNNNVCALVDALSNGVVGVKCWGYNAYGQVGDASNVSRNAPANVFSLSSGIIKIAGYGGVLDYDHYCALKSDGSVHCWGYNGNGQLGNSFTTDSNQPVPVTGLSSGVDDISVGDQFSCARLSATGEVKCWGDNALGQLGNYSITDSLTPTNIKFAIDQSDRMPKIYTGVNHTCSTYENKLYCWGDNNYGQLGTGTTVDSTTAVLAANFDLPFAIDKVLMGLNHTCILSRDKDLYCFGQNDRGQLGDSTFTDRMNLRYISRLVTSVAGFNNHNCLFDTASMKCWGANDYGQLGDGTTTDRNAPTRVVTDRNFSAEIYVGGNSTCANASGSTYCWGDNSYGQLGLGAGGASQYTEPQVVGLNFVDLSIGSSHSCGIVNDSNATGSVLCAGKNTYGQLGKTGSDQMSFNPVVGAPAELFAPIQVRVGDNHSCVRDNFNGKLFCWGNNNLGQLGQSRIPLAYAPTYIPGVDNIVDMNSSGNYVCYIQKVNSTSSALKAPQCFGGGSLGQLGNGGTSDTSYSTFVSGAP